MNPHKCIIYVETGFYLRFIVSKHGIFVDPFKVEAILDFSPPHMISKLQSLQGKETFLRRFTTNYVEITKGFMRLLKKGVPFVWDE